MQCYLFFFLFSHHEQRVYILISFITIINSVGPQGLCARTPCRDSLALNGSPWSPASNIQQHKERRCWMPTHRRTHTYAHTAKLGCDVALIHPPCVTFPFLSPSCLHHIPATVIDLCSDTHGKVAVMQNNS